MVRIPRQALVNLAILLAIPATGLAAIAVLATNVPEVSIAIEYITTSSIR